MPLWSVSFEMPLGAISFVMPLWAVSFVMPPAAVSFVMPLQGRAAIQNRLGDSAIRVVIVNALPAAMFRDLQAMPCVKWATHQTGKSQIQTGDSGI